MTTPACPGPGDAAHLRKHTYTRTEETPMSTHEQFAVEEVGPSCWRVTFSNGEINLIDPDTIE